MVSAENPEKEPPRQIGSMEDHGHMMLGHIGLSREDLGDPDNMRKLHNLGEPQQDIGNILQQIMTITEESLDEAQAR